MACSTVVTELVGNSSVQPRADSSSRFSPIDVNFRHDGVKHAVARLATAVGAKVVVEPECELITSCRRRCDASSDRNTVGRRAGSTCLRASVDRPHLCASFGDGPKPACAAMPSSRRSGSFAELTNTSKLLSAHGPICT